MDRQKYYETKLHKLMNSPQIKKCFELAAKGQEGAADGDGAAVTPAPVKQVRTMKEALD